jgi:hypothetical protein
MKNSSHTIGNRNRDLLACSAAPQPTAPPRPYIIYFTAGSRVHFQGSIRMILVQNSVVGQVFLPVLQVSPVKDTALNVLYSYPSICHRRHVHLISDNPTK